MSLVQLISQQLAQLSDQQQQEVLDFVEFLAQKYASPQPEEVEAGEILTRFSFMGTGDSGGKINEIENLRDFAYDD